MTDRRFAQQDIENQGADPIFDGFPSREMVGFDGQHLQRMNASNLNILTDYVGGTNPIYLATAAPGTSTSEPFWQIKKLTFDGNNNITSITYANGSSAFDQIYDDRASLSYS